MSKKIKYYTMYNSKGEFIEVPFLSFTETRRENAVEELFCIPFARLPCSLESVELLRSIFSDGIDPERLRQKIAGSIRRDHLAMVITRSLKYCTAGLDSEVLLYLSMATDTPAIAVMYLAFVQYWAKNHDQRQITCPMLFKDIYPEGHPSEDDLHLVWEHQKVRPETHQGNLTNLLDYPAAHGSIQF